MPGKSTRRRAVNPGLEALLSPVGAAEFLERFWPGEAVAAHGPPARLGGLIDLREVASVERLLEVPCERVLVRSPTAEGRFEDLPVAASLAPALLDAGMTLSLVGPRFEAPAFHAWLEALREELELEPGVLRPSAVVSRRGPGARLHFDDTESFIVQVRGRKVWTVAPNEHVPNPPAHHVAGREPRPELAPLVPPGGLPTTMPVTARRYELRPGSVLFVPRGWWHTTETLEDSLHLDLRMTLPTWAHALLSPITEAVARMPHWRAPATNLALTESMARQLADDVAALVLRHSGHD